MHFRPNRARATLGQHGATLVGHSGVAEPPRGRRPSQWRPRRAGPRRGARRCRASWSPSCGRASAGRPSRRRRRRSRGWRRCAAAGAGAGRDTDGPGGGAEVARRNIADAQRLAVTDAGEDQVVGLPLPAMWSASSAARNAGIGTSRRWWVFGDAPHKPFALHCEGRTRCPAATCRRCQASADGVTGLVRAILTASTKALITAPMRIRSRIIWAVTSPRALWLVATMSPKPTVAKTVTVK